MVPQTPETRTLPDPDSIERTLQAALGSGGDFAEVFAEDRRGLRAGFDDGRVEEMVSGRTRGAGIRVRAGASIGFAHTTDLSADGLRSAARSAAAAARAGGSRRR